MSLLGYGQDLNRDVLDEQEEQYRRGLESICTWITGQFVKPLIERQWLLKGIWPASLVWAAEWANKQPATAADMDLAAKAVVTLGATRLLTDETLLRLLSHVLPDFDVAAEMKALAAQKPDEVGRMAQAADNTADDGSDSEDGGDNGN
jgi:hypothetical protein